MTVKVQRALREVRDTLLSNPVSPRVERPRDINLHYCRYVAETVADELGDEAPVEILEDGGRGYVHTWICHDGWHYDAECVGGVEDSRDLPFFRRHPEAAVHVEPHTADPAALRNRGTEPLYPDAFTPPASASRTPSMTYWRYAALSLLLGGLLIGIGYGGERALHDHLIGPSALLATLFVDFELVGGLVVVVAPIVFFVLLPAHRTRSPR